MTDKEIQLAVLYELEEEPLVKSTEIGVAVKDGIVTLSGYVDSYSKKYNAELAAKLIPDVKAVVNELEVKLPSSSERTDQDIAQAAVKALASAVVVPSERIKVTVREGTVTLEGDVEWQWQKEAAEAAVRVLTGVKEIANRIEVKPRVTPAEVQAKIEEALRRAAELDAHRIQIEMQDRKVILSGSVRCMVEWDQAERAAWQVPGVKEVENRLTIEPYTIESL
jgi:osmotically-inducible protein OsmY